jgi:hypothetical protein
VDAQIRVLDKLGGRPFSGGNRIVRLYVAVDCGLLGLRKMRALQYGVQYHCRRCCFRKKCFRLLTITYSVCLFRVAKPIITCTDLLGF